MSQTSSPAVRLEILPESIAVLTFDQPGSRANTLSQAVLGEFEAHLASIKNLPDLHGLVLRSGKPGMFIAGADLRELGGARPEPALAQKLVGRGLGLVAAFENLPFPTVAAVDGSCLGGGLELSLGFDYRLASNNPKTELGLPETKIGLIPGWGGTQRLSRLLGPSLAAELICAGETVKPERAKQIGLVFDSVPADLLLAEALRLIRWARADDGWRAARVRKQQPVGLSEEQASFGYAVARAQVLSKSGRSTPFSKGATSRCRKGCRSRRRLSCR
jgi:enoyl-CoA hydratase/carnithine racemase